MRKPLYVIIGIIILCFPTSLRADERNGTDLLNGSLAIINMAEQESKNNKVIGQATLWIGYYLGVLDTSRALGTRYYCMPEQGISFEQMARIVHKYLTDHPERLHEPAFVLFLSALSISYPCQKE